MLVLPQTTGRCTLCLRAGARHTKSDRSPVSTAISSNNGSENCRSLLNRGPGRGASPVGDGEIGAEPVGDVGPGETGVTGAVPGVAGAVPGPVCMGAEGTVGASSVGEGTGEAPSMKHGASPQTEHASPWSRILERHRQAVNKAHQVSGRV